MEASGRTLAFPCGKCYPCLARRVSGWSFRLVKEAERSSSSFFVTYTYDSEHVHLTAKKFMTLDKRDHQLLMKKMRKLHDEKLKYFSAGEYGGRYNRPHIHSILYNADLSTLIGKKLAGQVNLGVIPLDGEKPFTCDLWPHGHITIGQVTEASIGYTLKYMMKPTRIPVHKNDDRLPEFQLISKGLGENYLTDNIKQWHYNDLLDRMYCNIPGGKKIAMPRYYKNKLYTAVQREQIGQHLADTMEKKDLLPMEEINRFEYYEQKKKRARLQTTL